MALGWSALWKGQLNCSSALFGLIFLSCLWSHYSSIFVMWPVSAILLHNRWFIQRFARVSLGVSHVSCQHYRCPLLSSCFIFFMFSLKWNKNLMSTQIDCFIWVRMHACTVYLCPDSRFVSWSCNLQVIWHHLHFQTSAACVISKSGASLGVALVKSSEFRNWHS